jgi:cob(I)alamin adenosyltransferase
MNWNIGTGYQQARDVQAVADGVLDEAIETLRWCRQHMGERKASEELHTLQTRLGYLSLALSWEMDGETQRADSALGVANGRSRRQQALDRQVWEDMFWAH